LAQFPATGIKLAHFSSVHTASTLTALPLTATHPTSVWSSITLPSIPADTCLGPWNVRSGLILLV